MTRSPLLRRALVVVLAAASLLTARDGANGTRSDAIGASAPKTSTTVERTAVATGTGAPESPLHNGAAPHTTSGIVADDLTSLREEEWRWVRRAAEVGEKVAFAEMVEAYDADPTNTPHCHQLVHELGRQSYQRHQDLATALSFENKWCGGGFSHGVFEAWGRAKDVMASSADLSETCLGLRADPNACGHGIGHAIMQSAPPLSVAIDRCSGLREQYQWPCIDGVTMMYAMSFLKPAKDDPRADKGFDIKGFCALIPSRWAERCEYAAGALWLGVTDHEDRGTAMRQCLLLGRDALAPQRCAYGIGETVLDQTSWDAAKVFSVCRSGPAALADSCAESALRNLARVAREAKRPDPCLALTGADRAFCTTAAASRDRRESLS